MCEHVLFIARMEPALILAYLCLTDDNFLLIYRVLTLFPSPLLLPPILNPSPHQQPFPFKDLALLLMETSEAAWVGLQPPAVRELVLTAAAN